MRSGLVSQGRSQTRAARYTGTDILLGDRSWVGDRMLVVVEDESLVESSDPRDA